MKDGRIYESILYLQLERAVGVFVIAGIRPIGARRQRRLPSAIVDASRHAALTPVGYRRRGHRQPRRWGRC